MNYGYLLMAICGLSCEFTFAQTSGNALVLPTIINLTTDSPLTLGKGVNTINSDARADCINFDNTSTTEFTGQVVSYQANLVSSRRQFNEFVGASISGEAGVVGGWSASASAVMSNSNSMNSYDVNYVVKVNVENQGKVLNSVLLKPSILARLASESDPLTWFSQTCGDSYVSKIVAGGELLALLTLATKNTQESNYFSSQMRGATLTFSAQGEFSKTVTKLQDDSSLSIAMSRSGGNGLELPDSLEKLSSQVRVFPKSVSGIKGAPLRAVLQSYLTVQNLPNKLRIPISQRVQSLRNLIDSYNSVRDEIDRIGFITSHQTQFYLDPFDVPVLAAESVQLFELSNKLKQRVIDCASSGIACFETIPNISKGQVYPGRK